MYLVVISHAPNKAYIKFVMHSIMIPIKIQIQIQMHSFKYH